MAATPNHNGHAHDEQGEEECPLPSHGDFCRSLSMPTASTMTAPMMISCANVDHPIWFDPLRKTAMIKAPIIDPRTVPAPPFRLAPPITTAAMTSNSKPTATVGSPTASRDICRRPANPKNKPAIE